MDNIELEKARLRKLLKHINGVQANCNELAFRRDFVTLLLDKRFS